MSGSGIVITTHTQMTGSLRLSVSSNDTIYLTDWEIDLCESTDDGISWNLVFKSSDEWHYWQMIKVDHSDHFWTLELNENNNYYLRVYSVDRRRLVEM